MEILTQFGFNWLLLSAQIVNFLIIFYLLKRFAYKPIMQVLHERETSIKEGIRQNEEARRMYEDATQKEKEVMQKAQIEARTLMEDAKAQGALIMQETKAQAKKHAEQIMREAKEQIMYESRQAEKRLATHIGKLAMHMLEKSAGALFTKQDQATVMKRAVQYIREKDKAN